MGLLIFYWMIQVYYSLNNQLLAVDIWLIEVQVIVVLYIFVNKKIDEQKDSPPVRLSIFS